MKQNYTEAGAQAYERRLMREIEGVEKRIVELTAERDALRRQLIKARSEATVLRDVTRINSGTRIMVEARMLDALSASGKPLKNAELFSEARKANFELNPTTFRTYLMRLRERGKIRSPKRGLWTLDDQGQAPF